MSTLSIHGDVHIPDNIIRALGLKPGAELTFECQGDAIVMRPVKTIKSSRVEEGPKILSYAGQTVTLEEMDNAIAKARCNRCEVRRYQYPGTLLCAR